MLLHVAPCCIVVHLVCDIIETGRLPACTGLPFVVPITNQLGGGLIQHTCEDNKTDAGVVKESSRVLQSCGTGCQQPSPHQQPQLIVQYWCQCSVQCSLLCRSSSIQSKLCQEGAQAHVGEPKVALHAFLPEDHPCNGANDGTASHSGIHALNNII